MSFKNVVMNKNNLFNFWVLGVNSHGLFCVNQTGIFHAKALPHMIGNWFSALIVFIHQKS